MRVILLGMGFAALLSLLAPVSAFSSFQADESLVLYFSFDKDSGKEVRDLSELGNDGKVSGDPKWVDGKYGKAISLNGQSEWVEVESSDSLNIEGEITLMCWFKSGGWDGAGDQWIGKGAHASKPSCYGLMVYQSATLYFMLGDGASRHDLKTTELPETGKWHHIAATYDGENMRVYLDGDVLAEKQEQFDFQCKNELPLMVGGGVQRPQYSFLGEIDEVAIFNRALSQDEVKKAMEGIGALLAVEPMNRLPLTWGFIKAE
jgi:hypothetical protein